MEIRRQARRLSAGGWARHDTINAVLLGLWAEAALILTILDAGSMPVRAVGLFLALGYAASCGYYVTERRRTIASEPTVTSPGSAATVSDFLDEARPVREAAPADH